MILWIYDSCQSYVAHKTDKPFSTSEIQGCLIQDGCYNETVALCATFGHKFPSLLTGIVRWGLLVCSLQGTCSHILSSWQLRIWKKSIASQIPFRTLSAFRLLQNEKLIWPLQRFWAFRMRNCAWWSFSSLEWAFMELQFLVFTSDF